MLKFLHGKGGIWEVVWYILVPSFFFINQSIFFVTFYMSVTYAYTMCMCIIYRH